jgi:hypothetical protein
MSSIPVSRYLLLLIGLVLLEIGTAVAPAGANPIPDPIFSFGEERLAASPNNQTVDPSAVYTYRYWLRDANNDPIAFFPPSQVWLDFTDCTRPSTRPSSEIHPESDSNQDGEMVWRESLTWGGADWCEVVVKMMGVTFTVLEGGDAGGGSLPAGGPRSPDIDGDGLIAVPDVARWQQSFVTGAPPWIGDLAPPFDGTVALADFVVWQKHFVAP